MSNARIVYKVLALLLGYGLIIAAFLILGGGIISNDVLTLDIIVSCLIYTVYAVASFFPLINTKDSSHKEVGMLGINMFFLTVCTVLSIGLMICGIIWQIPFTYQLLGQLAIVLIALVGRGASLQSGEKVKEIHHLEQAKKQGRDSLKTQMMMFMEEVYSSKRLDPQCVARLEKLQQETRFVTPSLAPEAQALESQFVQSVQDLRVLMYQQPLDMMQINDKIASLERTLLNRKRY